MTWYRGDERIGDDQDAAQCMLDAALAGTDDGDMYMEAFRNYLNSGFEPFEVLETCTHDGMEFNDFFIDWAIDQLQYNDAYGERFGFTWRDEE